MLMVSLLWFQQRRHGVYGVATGGPPTLQRRGLHPDHDREEQSGERGEDEDDDIMVQHPFVHRGRLTVHVPERDVMYSSFVSPEWARLARKHRSEYGIKDSLHPLTPGDHRHHHPDSDAIRHNMALLRSYLYKRRIRIGRAKPLDPDTSSTKRPPSPDSEPPD